MHLREKGGFTDDQINETVMNVWESELANEEVTFGNATENKSHKLEEFLNECKP